MKLESVTALFVLVVLGLIGAVSGLCLVRNEAEPSVFWYQCSMSNDYLADVKTAPIDIERVVFTNSKMLVIKNRSFTRLTSGLEILEIYFSEIGEIEDDAFEGLGKLISLEIEECNLKIVKGAWFKGLFSLRTISFRGNEIKRIEDSFFSIVPPLESLDISENDLSCLKVASLGNFKTKVLRIKHNLFSWECIASLVDWLKKRDIQYDDFKRGSWDSSMELVLECQDILRKTHVQPDGENLKKCMEKRALQLLLPQENYTVDQICKFLKDTPSPFFNCSK